MYNKQVCINV